VVEALEQELHQTEILEEAAAALIGLELAVQHQPLLLDKAMQEAMLLAQRLTMAAVVVVAQEMQVVLVALPQEVMAALEQQ
jgi:hypothetical protein